MAQKNLENTQNSENTTENTTINAKPPHEQYERDIPYMSMIQSYYITHTFSPTKARDKSNPIEKDFKILINNIFKT